MLRTKSFRRIVICTLIGAVTALAHAEFEEVLPNLPDYELVRIDSSRTAPSGEFPSDIVEEYGFLSFTQWRIQPGAAILDVYEMIDTQAAYGLFTIWEEDRRDSERCLLMGLENRLIEGRLAFWRGHYFFILHSYPAQEDFLSSFPPLLKKAIDERSLHPVSVYQLPGDHLVRPSIRFYVGQKALATNPAIPRQLIGHLGFEDQAEATIARYEPDGFPLLLLAYPTASVAEEYAGRIQDALQSVFSEDGIYMKRSGPLLGLFLGPLASANPVLEDLQYTATVEWVHEEDTLLRDLERNRAEIVTFFGLVTNSILFTGFFILFVLALGIGVGFLRMALLRWFPAMSRGAETIFLDLQGRKG